MLPQKAERTRLQKSIVALQNLALSGNLTPPCPSENPILPDSKVSPQLLKSIPQSYIFFQTPLPPFAWGGGGVFYVPYLHRRSKHIM